MAIINLIEKDNGTTIKANTNDVVEITLKWNPSTGYLWQSGDTTAGDLIEVSHSADTVLPGAPATVYFKFKIKNSGILELFYAQPFGETHPPVKWFDVNVTV